MMTFEIRTVDDLQNLVDEKKEESQSLEFKSRKIEDGDIQSATKKLAIEVSAFANGFGGQIVVGIDESDQKDSASYASSIQGLRSAKWKSESVMARLETLLSPAVLGLSCREILLEDASWCLLIDIPQSSRAPHQAPDQKYYARRQYQKIPMVHYEIEDVRNRQRVRVPRVRLSVVFDRKVFVELRLENNGDHPVFDLKFSFPDAAKSAFKMEAPALVEGLTVLNPGEVLSFYIGGLRELFANEQLHEDTKICLDFRSEDENQHSTYVIINLKNHDRSSFIQSDIDHFRDAVTKEIKNLSEKVEHVSKVIEDCLGTISGPTGLQLSNASLARIAPAADEDGRRRLDAVNWRAIAEITGLDDNVAMLVERQFRYFGQTVVPEEITAEVIKKLEEKFIFDHKILAGKTK